jgi:ArsR family transcriptional regulator, arsenate/arsenite/antimonite-responsive transcriptional repressor
VVFSVAVAGAAHPTITPRSRADPAGCPVAVSPDLTIDEALGLAAVAKALGDQTRVRIVDVLRKAAPEAVCQYELVPLFDMSQPALAKHLKVLVGAGVVATERRGLWAYYFLPVDSPVPELRAWLEATVPPQRSGRSG